IFICENNYFSMGTHLARSNPLKAIVDRAQGYNMAGTVIDGMDFRTVREELGKVVDTVRKTQEPHFVEMRTYRYRGHSMSDPATYRTKEELDKYKELDPIAKLSTQLIDEKKLTKAAYDEMDAKAKKVTADAVKFADESPLPPVEAIYDYTFV
ncbi:MAG: pyruvate dehydrogenase (acetyl-transferring) E1 component subunit alpha, partial [Verrucomicrobia bacterium]|nr:pyruvate dehydrogenase (acetyl-transferring) E1 component subunit alpha [Verrucomicrobiota bacterium]